MVVLIKILSAAASILFDLLFLKLCLLLLEMEHIKKHLWGVCVLGWLEPHILHVVWHSNFGIILSDVKRQAISVMKNCMIMTRSV